MENYRCKEIYFNFEQVIEDFNDGSNLGDLNVTQCLPIKKNQ